MDGMHGNDASMHLADAQDGVHVHYDHNGLHHHMSNINGMADDGNGTGNGDGEREAQEAMEGVVGTDPGHLSDGRALLDRGGDVGDQLTLSFQGQVYVFDSVSPDKVQAVLLLLGGREVPSSTPGGPLSSHQSSKGLSGTPQRFSVPQRLASLIRFREKRKERNFDKKIRYTVRKEVALRMQRHKGQFTSSKLNQDDSSSAVTSWGSNQSWGSDANGSQPQETFCRHCGISEKSTPMMRRGPEGPRTLCNACGLMWANKGTLRDLSKAGPQAGQNSSRNQENGNFEVVPQAGHNSSANRNQEMGKFESEQMVSRAAGGNASDSS